MVAGSQSVQSTASSVPSHKPFSARTRAIKAFRDICCPMERKDDAKSVEAHGHKTQQCLD